jgi:protein gp37
MGKTKIEWAKNADGSSGATWNPVRARNRETGKVGTWCQAWSPGCKHCYAAAHNHRNLPAGSSGLPYTAQGGELAEIFIDPEKLAEPLRRRKPETFFVCSMTDLFQAAHSFELIAAVWGVMAACPQHTFQVLTKRPERALEFLLWAAEQGEELRAAIGEEPPSGTPIPSAMALLAPFEIEEHDQLLRPAYHAPWPLSNVWLGTSVENQECADKRIPDLLASPAAVRFLSIEPLLGPIDLDMPRCERHNRVNVVEGGGAQPWCIECDTEASCGWWLTGDDKGIDWVIVGGESGHGARPMHPAWVRSLRDQCTAAGVPFFFKQMTDKNGRKIPYESIPADLQIREMPNAL